VLGKTGTECGLVTDIKLFFEKTRPVPDPVKPGLFQSRVIIGIEIINPDDFVPIIKQPFGKMIADKPGGSGNKDFHDLVFSIPNAGKALPGQSGTSLRLHPDTHAIVIPRVAGVAPI
jgi:hypothetical protein